MLDRRADAQVLAGAVARYREAAAEADRIALTGPTRRQGPAFDYEAAAREHDRQWAATLASQAKARVEADRAEASHGVDRIEVSTRAVVRV
jgi:hypothetical protein